MPLNLGEDEAVHKERVTVTHLEVERAGWNTFELMDIVPPIPHNLTLPEGYTPVSDEGRLKLEELMAMCTKLSKQVLDLEKEKDAQAVESSDDDLDEDDASKQGRNSDKTKPMFKDSDFDGLDDDVENVKGETVYAITKVSVVSTLVNTVGVSISTAEPRTPLITAATAFVDEDLTIAQTLVKIRSEKAKEKEVAFRDVEEAHRLIRSTTTLQSLPSIDPKEKEYFERRKKQLAAERAEAIRNKPSIRTQVRIMMITYLKHI
nr:hypothetical protein [Tanacetum cinerariifolium]GFA74850.1 hypothetical protein [Tanacetum cinerariifolium]